jgi:hypothetical protein
MAMMMGNSSATAAIPSNCRPFRLLHRLPLFVLLLLPACTHGRGGQQNTVAVARPYERSTEPVQETLSVDLNADEVVRPLRKAPSRSDLDASPGIDGPAAR